NRLLVVAIVAATDDAEVAIVERAGAHGDNHFAPGRTRIRKFDHLEAIHADRLHHLVRLHVASSLPVATLPACAGCGERHGRSRPLMPHIAANRRSTAL